MATIGLDEIYEPVIFNAGVRERSAYLNNFIRSGIVYRDPRLDLAAENSTYGRTGYIVFGKQLDDTEANYSSDDDSSTSTPINTGSQSSQQWILSALNQSWSAMDLAREVAAEDPLDNIIERVAHYWSVQMQLRLIYTCVGLAEGNSDMVYDAYSDIVTPLAANVISASNILKAQRTLGDVGFNITGIAMHSDSFYYLNELDLIDYVKGSDGRLFTMFRGMEVIVNDALPVTTGTNSDKYLTVLFGSGAFAWGSGRPLVPSEIDRKADSGDGGGETILHSRISEILHPVGFTYDSTIPSDSTPTLLDINGSANWDRVYDRKSVNMAFLYHNVII